MNWLFGLVYRIQIRSAFLAWPSLVSHFCTAVKLIVRFTPRFCSFNQHKEGATNELCFGVALPLFYIDWYFYWSSPPPPTPDNDSLPHYRHTAPQARRDCRSNPLLPHRPSFRFLCTVKPVHTHKSVKSFFLFLSRSLKAPDNVFKVVTQSTILDCFVFI